MIRIAVVFALALFSSIAFSQPETDSALIKRAMTTAHMAHVCGLRSTRWYQTLYGALARAYAEHQTGVSAVESYIDPAICGKLPNSIDLKLLDDLQRKITLDYH